MSISARTIARVGLAALPALGLLALGAGPAAAAKPRNGSTPATCDVEDNGVTTQVPEGTRVGLFYCGSDGEWHFGTVILDWPTAKALDPGTPVKPVTATVGTVGTIQRGARR